MSFFTKASGGFAVLRSLTLLLIVFLATSQIYLLSPFLFSDYLNINDERAFIHLICFDIGVVYILWTFYLVSARHPGRVKNDYTPPRPPIADLAASSHTAVVHAESQGSASAVRWCKHCRGFRPPRSHHCKKCKTCVLRMDHHCPWLDSCVGYSNHAIFIKFLFVVWIVTGYLCYQSVRCFVWLLELEDQRGPPFSANDDDGGMTLIVICGIIVFMSGILCIMVLGLWIYQVWNALENTTTIEAWSHKRVEELVQRKKVPATAFPYDLHSFRRNLRSLFGGRWYLWWWPSYSAASTGYVEAPESYEQSIPAEHMALFKTGHAFLVNEDHDPHLPWPPIDPTRAQVQSSRQPAGFTFGQEAVTDVAAFERRRQAAGVRQRASPTIVGQSSGSAALASLKRIERQEFYVDDPESDDEPASDERTALIQESDEEDDLIEGEALASYGVDEAVEAQNLNDVVHEEGGRTVAQLLEQKRQHVSQ